MPAPLPNWPEGLSAEQAAAYVGVGRTRFLEEVDQGTWHRPDKRGRRRVWCRAKLQAELVSRYDGGPRKIINMAERLAR